MEQVILNSKLIAKQGLDLVAITTLKALHKRRIELEEEMKEVPEHLLKTMFENWTDIQYQLQEVWGFPKDSKFHAFWTVPRCTCPKIDNTDAWPSGYYTYNVKCPVHGGV